MKGKVIYLPILVHTFQWYSLIDLCRKSYLRLYLVYFLSVGGVVEQRQMESTSVLLFQFLH